MSMTQITIKRKPRETIEKMTRRFKKAVDDTQLFQELREREFFQKPSVKKRKKRMRAEACRQKDAQLKARTEEKNVNSLKYS